ncbi:branched chain amino acid ABC transporter substrate-binding protein [Formosimonas limnophila]|uniref:Branched chain amino acid ABC transporter substrate-binding protein n=1 Tax=Formosimonas limnophila TaxID=1384487 RepID=A0A8J3CLH8_9BURK|nr:branched-chain amino acid ABC transporter substrate-binding protein [Formosimonas limnophila]GHA66814.1 branched chain amino acid ABC transporter substrate-binding protein [Formosimonas limnophila]
MRKHIVISIVLSVFFVGSAHAACSTKTPIKIGYAGPMSGGIAHLGKDAENGASMAIEEINRSGGITIDGQARCLKLFSADDAGDPRQGVVVAQKLVDKSVMAVVGHLNSGISIPANDIYSANGMAQISPSSTNPDYTLKSSKTPKGSVSSYRVIANDVSQGKALAMFVNRSNPQSSRESHLKRIVVLDDSTQYGRRLADYFVSALQTEPVVREGIFVPDLISDLQPKPAVIGEAIADRTPEFRRLLAMSKKFNPDYIFWGGLDDTAAILAKQMKQLGVRAKLISSGECMNEFIELAKDTADQTVCAIVGIPLENTDRGRKFSSDYERRFPGERAQIYAPYTYDAVQVVAQAIRIAGSDERESIAAAMPKVNYDGVTGNIRFDAQGDVQLGAVSLFKVENKKLVFDQVILVGQEL